MRLRLPVVELTSQSPEQPQFERGHSDGRQDNQNDRQGRHRLNLSRSLAIPSPSQRLVRLSMRARPHLRGMRPFPHWRGNHAAARSTRYPEN